jgi:hypothetical protein
MEDKDLKRAELPGALLAALADEFFQFGFHDGPREPQRFVSYSDDQLLAHHAVFAFEHAV